MWTSMSDKRKAIEIELWKVEGPLRQAAREKRGIFDIPVDDKDFEKTISAARLKFSVPIAPAMPLIALIQQKKDMRFLRQAACGKTNKHTNHKSHNNISKHGATCSDRAPGKRGHQEREAYSGEASEHYMGMVHTPIPMGKAMRIPK